MRRSADLEDWFASVASHYGPLEPIDSADTLALAEAEANVAVAEAGVRLARSQRIPDLTVSAGARRFEETGDTAALIGLSIPLPLFNSGKAALAQASSERRRADAQRRLAAMEADRSIRSEEHT